MLPKKFKYPGEIIGLLDTLTTKYEVEGDLVAAKVTKSRDYELEEAVDYDNWDGGTYGHKLILRVPTDVYKLMGTEINRYAQSIKDALNRLESVPNEYIYEVSIQVGLKSSLNMATIDDSMWGAGFRVFISHSADYKTYASALKDQLRKLGMSAFVAHEDIEPNREWQLTIENALLTMDAFVALITEDYNGKIWTNQEIGFAYCLNKTKNIPFISIRAGGDPAGFFGPKQALKVQSGTCANQLCSCWADNPKMIDSFIEALEKSASWDQTEALLSAMECINVMNDTQVDRIVEAAKGNSQLYDCFYAHRNLRRLLRKWSRHGVDLPAQYK